MVEHKPFKIDNALLGVAGIFAIFLIAYMAITFDSSVTSQSTSTDVSGQAIQVLQTTQSLVTKGPVCKLIVGQTTIYDGTTLAVSMRSGDSAYYSGYTVRIEDINVDGCVVNINGNRDYIAAGQIQRLGPLYVTVKMVAQ